LLDYYESTGRLGRIDGTQDRESIYEQIEQVIASK